MSRILISACLMGAPVRYDGRAKTLTDALLTRWQAEGRLVPLCPEVAAGLPTPRPPAELAPGVTAAQVLDGTGSIRTDQDADVSHAFVRGAEIALRIALAQGCSFALLTDASPSCGSLQVYAGRHDGTRIAGRGVVAEHLIRHGITVFAPSQITDLAARLG
ncbi:DUF523 domain-containing protein [Pararhodobacter zhoushanensis]|uniref:DUF523 domain-containing protein n=1 Tax=Pararhodobacter zhoushanensis TaxID=2479545 RepID=UPI000F8F0002|nr:DUF523 domain-containing protein [Pararhodobacter zhoushanensis]